MGAHEPERIGRGRTDSAVIGSFYEVDAATFTASCSAPMTVPATSRHFGP
jgi:hypothetical protein